MLLNLLSMLDCLSFSVEGGGTPCVHVRFDNPELLQQLADSNEYHNLILDANERIFEEQIDLFSSFFGTDALTDEQRWDFVEEYFTGTGVEELKRSISFVRPCEPKETAEGCARDCVWDLLMHTIRLRCHTFLFFP